MVQDKIIKIIALVGLALAVMDTVLVLGPHSAVSNFITDVTDNNTKTNNIKVDLTYVHCNDEPIYSTTSRYLNQLTNKTDANGNIVCDVYSILTETIYNPEPFTLYNVLVNATYKLGTQYILGWKNVTNYGSYVAPNGTILYHYYNTTETIWSNYTYQNISYSKNLGTLLPYGYYSSDYSECVQVFNMSLVTDEYVSSNTINQNGNRATLNETHYSYDFLSNGEQYIYNPDTDRDETMERILFTVIGWLYLS